METRGQKHTENFLKYGEYYFRLATVKQLYKMGAADLLTLETFADGKCMSCGEKFEDNSDRRRPHIEHCHSTGNIRGYVCMSCNRIIGCLENPKLHKASEFLANRSRHPFFFFEEVHWSPANQDLLEALDGKPKQVDMYES